MNPMPEQEKEQLREQLWELTQACPLDQCNPEDCPLHSLRKMAPADRAEWFNALTQDDLVYLATYHHVCASLKAGPAKAQLDP